QSRVSALDPSTLFPARRSVAALVVCAALWTASATVAVRPGLARGLLGALGSSAAIDDIDVEVTPPAYAGRPTVRLTNPTRVDALAGSRIHVSVHSRATQVTLETIAGAHPLAVAGAAQFAGDVLADADGYLAVESSVNGRQSGRRLIGLSVTPDHAPRVHV